VDGRLERLLDEADDGRRGREALRGVLRSAGNAGPWSGGSSLDAPGCLPSGECSGGRTAEAARPSGKPVKPGPSGCGGAVDRRLDEAPARVTDGALRGACGARVGVESGGAGQRGFRLAVERSVGTRPVSGVVSRPMESSEGVAGTLRKHQAGQRQEGNGHREMIRLSERGKL
jgi:hypothetical protein